MTGEVYVVDAVRTKTGRYGGALSEVRPDDLAARTVGSLMERSPGLDPGQVDDVLFGNSNGAGEENRNVARMAVLLAGLPVHVPGATVNRLCGSGMEAAVAANRAIAVGDASICVAGGVESMSRAPWVVQKPEAGFQRTDQPMVSTTLGWRLVNSEMPAEWTVSLGEGAELLAREYDISRDAQDRFAVESHRRAAAAWERGAYDDETIEVGGVELERDEPIRPDTSVEKLAKLKPAFRSDGSVTAGNSSPLNDGAAALLLADEAGVEAIGRDPLARIVSRGLHAVDPPHYGVAPVEAANQALKRAGIGWGDIEVTELNEAFAAQALACVSAWGEVDTERLNVNGGAVALGHPIGCSGARILATLSWELRRRGGMGLGALCIGVGQGIAMVLEAA
ncbi:MAG TPA: thiolase family protein [Thermoleophilaceae bacterium]|nr:thiolase family protein [Thermoleophilaceae bacterium]